nr:hypothetical protein [Escherichia coli]
MGSYQLHQQRDVIHHRLFTSQPDRSQECRYTHSEVGITIFHTAASVYRSSHINIARLMKSYFEHFLYPITSPFSLTGKSVTLQLFNGMYYPKKAG